MSYFLNWDTWWDCLTFFQLQDRSGRTPLYYFFPSLPLLLLVRKPQLSLADVGESLILLLLNLPIHLFVKFGRHLYTKEDNELKKRKKKKGPSCIQRQLTFLFFPVKNDKDVKGRLWPKTVTSKCTRINEFVEILDRPCILNCYLNPLVKPAFKLRMLFHYKMQKQEKIKNNGQYEREKEEGGISWGANAPSKGVTHRRSNLGTSPPQSHQKESPNRCSIQKNI